MPKNITQSNIIPQTIDPIGSIGESTVQSIKYSVGLIDIILIPIILSVITTFTTIKISQYFENFKKNKDVLFEVYMKLIELEGYYMWVASAELHKEQSPKDIEQKVFSLKYEISDLMKKVDLDISERVLEILFLEEYKHTDRYRDINLLINELGEKVNPKYKKIMKSISNRNLEYFVKNLK